MDCGTAGTAAGIDPKILDNWQTDGFSSWERYDQPPEWDTSQESSQCDADIADLGSFQGPLTRSLLDQSSEFRNSSIAPDNFNYTDGTIEGTGSGTISPRTIPSSTDDNFHSDESWPHFQLINSVGGLGMPVETPLLYPYGKGQTPSAGAVIVDDAGEVPHDHGFSNASAEAMMSFHQIPASFQLVPEPWADLTPDMSMNHVDPAQGSVPLAMQSQQPKDSSLREFETASRSLELRWLDGLEPQSQMTAGSLQTTASAYQKNDQTDHVQYKSENSSVSGDLSGLYECSYSATSDDPPAFAEHKLDEDEWKVITPDSSSPEASHPVPAFVVTETPIELLTDKPSKSRSSSSAGQRTLAMQSPATVRKRKNRNSANSSDKTPAKPLQIVQEDGQGGAIASADFVTPPAGLCDGISPCTACRPTLHEQPCARACFSSIVEFGTCNYISQRAVNHPTIDGSTRVRMEIPSEFDLNQLLSFLGQRQGRFNIRASQSWGSLYVLDLGETYKFLKGLSEYNGNLKSTFLDFIDRRIVESKDKSKNWLSCVKDCDPMNNAYSLLSQWNNMPSRARYSFVSLDSTSDERSMDINNPEHQRDILLAAQLSRIVCRMLEVEGFRKLERDFYNIKWKQISHETHIRFLGELGQILLTLRWRVSWWKCLGDGGQNPDPSQQHYVDRVDLLCRILYVYYTCVLAKLPAWSMNDVPKGIWSSYADSANAVWDDFPSDPTDAGFQVWMDRGRELIEQAGVPSQISKFRR
ncbi:hypothetical protein N7510_002175 [Penicillium lagena]|uniref:uncharacterized protein n=1 Tax=Penicillium lagena TaxID=94218 RepID=UPI00254084B4|nr:uncharacterized protein N7510_002175 [Penicillium lagena]KAJ5625866.1 hypothetical protein N7510_002175 [Penicillium lagena]